MSYLQRTVYFMSCGDMVKIGCSKNVIARLRMISVWCPQRIALEASFAGTLRDEVNLHSHFSEEWSHGEWFKRSGRMVKMIKSIKRGAIPSLPDGRSQYRALVAIKGVSVRELDE